MTKRVTLSVSDELSERMEKWKDAFNYSGIFQEAVTVTIQRKEDFQKRLKEDPKMEQIIERLKKEREESEQDLLVLAKDWGLEWAKLAHYDELRSIVKSPNSSNTAYIMFMTDQTTENYEWLMENLEQYEMVVQDDLDESFFEAFAEGVEEFWNEVEDKL